MRPCCATTFLTLLSTLLLVGTAWADPSATKAAAASGVVVLVSFDAQGAEHRRTSGFFVSDDGKIASSRDILEGASRIEVSLADGRRIEALGVLIDAAPRDAVVLQLAGTEGTRPMMLGNSAAVQKGDEVVVFGPRDAITTQVTAASDDELRLASEFPRELAGAPIVQGKGEVVGLLSGALPTNRVVPASALSRALQSLPASSVAQPFAADQHSKSPVLRNLLISASVMGGVGLLLSAALYLDERRQRPRPKKPPAPPRDHDVS